MGQATHLKNPERSAPTPRPPDWHAAAQAHGEPTSGSGGWAVVMHSAEERRTASGGATRTTGVEMALCAALTALAQTPRAATLQITTSLSALHARNRLEAHTAGTHAAELERALRDALATRTVHWRWIARSNEDSPDGPSHQADTLARAQARSHRAAHTHGRELKLRTPITAAFLRRQLEQHPGETPVSSGDTAHTITVGSLANWLAIVPGATMLHAHGPIVIHTATARTTRPGDDSPD